MDPIQNAPVFHSLLAGLTVDQNCQAEQKNSGKMIASCLISSWCRLHTGLIAQIHDDVMCAPNSGCCSQTPGRFKNNGGK